MAGTAGGVRLRPFMAEDWPAAIEIANRIYPDAFFLMKDIARYVGLSQLEKNLSLPHVLEAGA